MKARALAVLVLTAGGCQGRPAAPTGPLADLVRAAGDGDAAAVRRIVESDPGLARASFEGAALGPVRAAVKKGRADIVRLLLDAGADPRERETSGLTPLHAARTVEIASLLLARGVSPDVRSSQGETPLMAATDAPGVVERLLEAGARPNLRDADGETALDHATSTASMDNVTSIATLCAFGADPDVRDEQGRSARDLARKSVAEGLGLRRQNAAMADILEKGGACDALRARARTSRATAAEYKTVAYEARCRAGDGWACGRVGWAYEHGEGVGKDLAAAARFYSLSCEAGDAWGCYALAYAYGQGDGVPRDDARAAGLFRRACDAGHVESCGQLARCLQRGRGVPRDAAAAVPLFDNACQAGEAWSCWQLGEAYASGLGVAPDAARAAALRDQACRGGEKRACAGGAGS